MDIYEKFLNENIAYFEDRLNEVTEHEIQIMGYSGVSVKQAFQKLVQKRDMYYFPYCLYLIQFGLGVTKDKDFSMNAFEKLLPDSKSYIERPFLAYICAYCYNRDGDLKVSEDILTHLTESHFAPAITTFGDLYWVKKDFENAKNYYRVATDLRHFDATSKYLILCCKGPKIFSRVKALIYYLLKGVLGQTRGEKFVYFDFYGFKNRN